VTEGEGPPPESHAAAGPVVAVDCNGADLGPGEVAAGAALAARQGTRVLLFGPAAELGELPDGVQVDDSPVSIAKAPDPVKAARTTPQASIVMIACQWSGTDATTASMSFRSSILR